MKEFLRRKGVTVVATAQIPVSGIERYVVKKAVEYLVREFGATVPNDQKVRGESTHTTIFLSGNTYEIVAEKHDNIWAQPGFEIRLSTIQQNRKATEILISRGFRQSKSLRLEAPATGVQNEEFLWHKNLGLKVTLVLNPAA